MSPAGDWIVGQKAPDAIRRPLHERVLLDDDFSGMALAPLQRIAEAQPDVVAVDDGDRQLTYAELWCAVQTLAATIRDVVPAGGIVLGLATPDAHFPVMPLAGHLAGRPVVMQDVASPADRRALILEEIRPAAVLISDAGVDSTNLPDATPRIRVALRPAVPVATAPRPVSRDELFSIGFTSGSVGRPKGLAMSTQSVLAYFRHYIGQIQLAADDVILSLGSPSTLGIRDALASFYSGARLRVFDFKGPTIAMVFDVFRRERPTVLGHVPSVVRMLMQLDSHPETFRSLRVLALGGEALTISDLELFRSRLDERCLIGCSFGTTEAGQILDWFVRDDAVTERTTPSGYLMEGRRVYLADEAGRPVPPGDVGELVVADQCVALGDWRDGQIDSSRFPIDPLSGHRMYATGDRLRLRPDGLFEFLGRRDRMVKVNGLRANLGDIEALLQSFPGVQEAVVVAKERESEHATLAAFITVQPGSSPGIGEMRRFIADKGGLHMAPAVINCVDAIPRLYNGKPDLRRLQQL